MTSPLFWVILLVIGYLYTATIRPRLVAWVEDRNLSTLLFAVEQGVAACYEKFTKSYKEKAVDGKLTKEQAESIMTECRAFVIDMAKSQGLDLIKTYSTNVIDYLCEAKLAELKESSLKKSALLPLESLVVSPENFSLPTN